MGGCGEEVDYCGEQLSAAAAQPVQTVALRNTAGCARPRLIVEDRRRREDMNDRGRTERLNNEKYKVRRTVEDKAHNEHYDYHKYQSVNPAVNPADKLIQVTEQPSWLHSLLSEPSSLVKTPQTSLLALLPLPINCRRRHHHHHLYPLPIRVTIRFTLWCR